MKNKLIALFMLAVVSSQAYTGDTTVIKFTTNNLLAPIIYADSVATFAFKITPVWLHPAGANSYLSSNSVAGDIDIQQAGIMHIDINLTGTRLGSIAEDTSVFNRLQFYVYGPNGGNWLIFEQLISPGTHKYSFNIPLANSGRHMISFCQTLTGGVINSTGNVFISFKPTVSIVNHKAYIAPVQVKTDNKSYSLSGKIIKGKCGIYIKNGRIKFNP